MEKSAQVCVSESVVASVVKVLHLTLECPKCGGVLGKVPGVTKDAVELAGVIIKCPFCGQFVRMT